jgi:hypothetical protein
MVTSRKTRMESRILIPDEARPPGSDSPSFARIGRRNRLPHQAAPIGGAEMSKVQSPRFRVASVRGVA